MIASAFALLLVSGVAAGQVPAVPEIMVDRRSETEFTLTIDRYDARVSAAVEARIVALSAELCGARAVEHGEFEYTTELGRDPGETPPQIVGFRKEIACIDAPEAVAAAVPDDWQPSEADVAAARGYVLDYFRRRDGGDYDAAFAMLEPGMVARDTWLEGVREFNRRAGAAEGRSIAKLTWYVNPAAAPKPGVYLAADFTGRFSELDSYCGYVILYRGAGGGYAIVREEANILARDVVAGKPADEVAQARALLPCAGG